MAEAGGIVTTRYLGFEVEILNERHVTIRDPDGSLLVRRARMNDRTVRQFIRGYRKQSVRPVLYKGDLEPA